MSIKTFWQKTTYKYYLNNKLQITIADIIPTIYAVNPANNTNLVFFIFTQLEYTAIVYKVVSVDPIIIAANFPINESTPFCFIISVAIAKDPLPEIGLSNANGIISFGILKISKNGDNIFIINSIIPEFLSNPIAKNNPIRVGNIFKIISKPWTAPLIKISKTFYLSFIPLININKINNGIDIIEI